MTKPRAIPAVWRIFQNNRWTYSDTPSTRHQDRPAWQPLYAQPEKEWVGLTKEEAFDLLVKHKDKPSSLSAAVENLLREKNNG